MLGLHRLSDTEFFNPTPKTMNSAFRFFVSLSLIVVSGLLLSACWLGGYSPTKLTGATMGTRYNIVLRLPKTLNAEQLKAEIDQKLADLNDVATTYDETSELMRFNRSPVGVPVQVSQPLYDLLEESKSIHQLTYGAFDVTVSRLVQLWGFGSQVRSGLPSEEEIAAEMQNIGFDGITLSGNFGDRWAMRNRDVEVDFSSIAKGHGVDMVADFLVQQGVTDLLVEIGGEMRSFGQNPKGRRWIVCIERPSLTGQQAINRVDLSGEWGVATSGDYRNYFMSEGKRYSHTIDPKTGWPVAHNLASVTVIDKHSARADALATGFSVLGYSRSSEICQQQNMACFFILRTETGFSELYTPAFEQFLN